MANVYRANILSYEPSANGTLNFDCFVERREGANPDFTWAVTSQGQFTLVLTASEILAITTGVGTNVQKRKALEDIIKERALERGVDVADDAYLAFSNLEPASFSVVIR